MGNKVIHIITIDPNKMKHKMDKEELEGYLKLKRGQGSHKSKKAYTRKPKYKNKID